MSYDSQLDVIVVLQVTCRRLSTIIRILFTLEQTLNEVKIAHIVERIPKTDIENVEFNKSLLALRCIEVQIDDTST